VHQDRCRGRGKLQKGTKSESSEDQARNNRGAELGTRTRTRTKTKTKTKTKGGGET
jgi:hypothetical protein